MVVAQEKLIINHKPDFYQGIGLLYGLVSPKQDKFTIDLQGNSFDLICYRQIKFALLEQLKNYPNQSLYLKVYPKFHLKEQNYYFQAVAFYTTKPQNEQINSFLLAGIWQFIPQLRFPVLTIYRNQLKEWEYKDKTKLKNHIPLLEFNERPFRFNPKNSTTKPKFYRLLAKFDPNQKRFKFQFLLNSSENLPRKTKVLKSSVSSTK
jgi:hypothetical protein